MRKRVVRILIYEGSEAWVNQTLERSLQGRREFPSGTITALQPQEMVTKPWEPWLSLETDKPEKARLPGA
jgi:hypothetical protein